MCSSDNVLQVVTLFKTIGLPSKPYTYSHGHITVEYHRPVSVSVNVLTTHVISYLTTLPYALVADLHSTRMVSDHVSVSVETSMTVLNGSFPQSYERPNITSQNGSSQTRLLLECKLSVAPFHLRTDTQDH